jgi:adenine-specific DNA methylase
MSGRTAIRRAISPGWQRLARAEAPELPFETPVRVRDSIMLAPSAGSRALEDDSFPFEALSDVAETESWRKEINRPTTHIHKWWAQRLGTVFRAMTIGAFAPSGANVFDLFYKSVRIPGGTVFDPFMGSGTTLAETVKLGARAIGRDINPVAHFLVKCALSVHDRKAILETFRAIERDVADKVHGYYRVTLPGGTQAEVLYYFWVKTADCPSCATPVDLFSSQIFARHAYPKKFPQAQAVCPHCGGVNEVHVEAHDAKCSSCRKTFNPNAGPAKGQSATCASCDLTFPIAKTIRATGMPPAHRLYAKLVLLPDGRKEYHPATDEDRALYAKAERALAKRKNAYPVVSIAPGYNTNQALGYNYRRWHDMFNARQLLCLSLLADRIRAIPDSVLRELFTCLFSGALEFNNMFASYKGEGTGAVRHMFAHHILKPERVPLEANLWGTEKSSGSFSTMFEGRIRRALDYADDPFELRPSPVKDGKTEKVFGLSEKIGAPVADEYAAFARKSRVYLSCGDSGTTDLPDRSVDVVLTDPPFFDNVHYSQLADFFHVWQRHILGVDGTRVADTTRSIREVQNAKAEDFTDRLASVWQETNRVLKDDGLLAFTYHHSRPEGWRCVLQALMQAGFGITAAHPIKAEMSVAMPKQQAKEPIDLDIIVVCRKRARLETHRWNGDLWGTVAPPAQEQVNRLRVANRKLSRNDVRIIVTAQLLRQLSRSPTLESALHLLDSANGDTEALIDRIHGGQNGQTDKPKTRKGAV